MRIRDKERKRKRKRGKIKGGAFFFGDPLRLQKVGKLRVFRNENEAYPPPDRIVCVSTALI